MFDKYKINKRFGKKIVEFQKNNIVFEELSNELNPNSQNRLNINSSDEKEFTNGIDNILNQRDLMIKAAIQRLRNNNTNQNITIKKKVFMPLENVELKWNINLL